MEGHFMDRTELMATLHLGFRLAVLCLMAFGGLVAMIPAR
jgi:hypothetical protein